MNKKELVQRAARVLRINNYKKPVHLPKQTMQVMLGDRTTSFSIKPIDRDVVYTVDDVERVLEAVLAVIVDAMKNGEETFLYGFGSFYPMLRAARRLKRVDTGEWANVKEHYVPHFESGRDLKLAAAVYGARVEEGDNPFYIDDDPGDFNLDDPDDPNDGGDTDA